MLTFQGAFFSMKPPCQELRELISGSQHNAQPCRAELMERFPEVFRPKNGEGWKYTSYEVFFLAMITVSLFSGVLCEI